MGGALPFEVRAIVVEYEAPYFVAESDDGLVLRFTAAFADGPPVVGMRVVLSRLRTGAGDEIESRWVEGDAEHREANEALQLAALEAERLAKARAERRPPQAPLLPGQHRGVLEIPPDGRSGLAVRLDDGRVARSYSTFKLLEEPGVRVVVRRTEERRGELWAADVELDQDHREDYERRSARRHFERVREKGDGLRARRGSRADELPVSAPATVVVADEHRSGVAHLDDGTRVTFDGLSCDGFEPEAGLLVTAGGFRRLPDGTVHAEDLRIDDATRAALRDRRRDARARVRPAGADAVREPSLEAAILAEPERVEPVRAYERWLRERGDVRAELIAADLAIEEGSPETAAGARVRRDELLADNAGFLLGALADPASGVELAFRRGFMQAARVSPASTPVVDRVALLLALPTARLLTELAIARADDGPRGYGPVLRELERAPAAVLERLALGDGLVDVGSIKTPIGDLERLARHQRRLRSLELTGAEVELEPEALPRLRRLVIRTACLPRATLQAIARGPWPDLDELVLWLGVPADKAPAITAADLEPLLSGEATPRLRHLGLCNTKLTNDLCRALARAPLAGRLARLDLSHGTLTDGGAAAIAAAARAFAALEDLDASGNLLTPAGSAYLREVVASARLEGQRSGYGEGRREIGVAP